MPHLTELQVLRFLIQLTLLFVIARALADVMKRLGQATVIGELLAGIVLGPTLLGHFAPGLHAMLFPPDVLADHLLEAVAWIGVIMLLLYTGLETDLRILRGVGNATFAVSALGVIVPAATGFALGWHLPAQYLAAPDQRLIFSLFMAVAMSISAVPVIAKILIDLDLMRRDLGLLILGAGILDDTVGWLMLSIVAGLAAHGVLDFLTFARILVAVIVFVGFCYYLGANLIVRLMRWVDDRALAEHAGVSTMVAVAMLCAIITQAIGIHAVFGAFIAGVMLGRSARLRRSDRSELQALTIGVFAPVFFAYSGLKVDLFALHGVGLLVLVLGIAIAGKLIGCTTGAMLFGMQVRESLAVAIGMNARGGMEIIVGLIGLSLGVLTQEMYAIIVMVAIATSLMTPPLLSWMLAGVKEKPEEAARTEREKLLARLPFSREGAKLLVLSGGGPHAQLAAHLAATLGNHHDASITVFHATTTAAPGPNGQADADFARIKSIAEASGAQNILQRSGSADSIAQAIVKESERGYDAIFAGASPIEGDYALGGEVLRELVDRVQVPVIIVRNVGASLPLRKILAPTTGAPFSRLGATLAMLYANATGAQMTALYVKEGPTLQLRDFYRRRVTPADGAPIAEELRQLGEQIGVKLETRIESGAKPENSILSAAEKGGFDLLVMGVMFRPSERRLYLGPKVEYVLRNARCAFAVVVTPEIAPPRMT
ncbi:MAG TPA: cation:proton antiporter [Candidatus Binataceae bacterium]|nr:cation:proton antiporter [Candidatus Binataceae bacterium]